MMSDEVVAIPVLRAGLGLLAPVLELLPRVSVGYIGLERDEETAVARIYYNKLPKLEGKVPLLLDPMLATGGSAAQALDLIKEAGGVDPRFICVVAAPEGVKVVEERHPEVHIYTAALDEGLNDKAYIVPGLGDFGDRLFGTGRLGQASPPCGEVGVAKRRGWGHVRTSPRTRSRCSCSSSASLIPMPAASSNSRLSVVSADRA